MQKFRPLLALFVVLCLLWLWPPDRATDAPVGSPATTRGLPGQSSSAALPGFLPPEAADTLALIASQGPYPHRQDGQAFGNREGRLPSRPRGHYREYTVRTPGVGHRGPRRIVTGGQPPVEFWYTDDHYASFRRFELPR